MPVLSDGGKEVDHFMIKMPAAEVPASQWKILIKDGKGNVIQAIEGTGALPSELAWDGKNREGMRINDNSSLQISLVSVDPGGKVNEIAGTVYSPAGQSLDWGDEKEERLALRIAPLSPGGPAFEMTMSQASLRPLPVILAGPSQQSLASPMAQVPSPTVRGTAEGVPAARRPETEESLAPARRVKGKNPPFQVLSSAPKIRIRSQLGSERLAFAFMPKPTPVQALTRHAPLSRELLAQREMARQPLVVDVFRWDSSREEKSQMPALDAAWQRYRGLGFKLIRLTGLVTRGENDGDTLSRARAVRMSELLSNKGFNGEFVVWVDGRPGEQKGVRIEALR
jgi:hypothetical protein